MIKLLKLKLTKMLSNFTEVTTDKGVLICDGEMVVGKEVFLIDADGEYVSAPNGDYIAGEITYKVMDGVISEIVEPEVEPVVEPEEENLEVEPEVEPVEEPTEPQITIEDVTKLINDLVNVVSNLDIRISKLEAEFSKIINESAGTPIETVLRKENNVIKDNKFERISNAIKKIKTN